MAGVYLAAVFGAYKTTQEGICYSAVRVASGRPAKCGQSRIGRTVNQSVSMHACFSDRFKVFCIGPKVMVRICVSVIPDMLHLLHLLPEWPGLGE